MVRRFKSGGNHTLVQKKQVCRDWKQLCTNAMDAKSSTETTQKAFPTNHKLQAAVKKYWGYFEIMDQYLQQQCSQKDAKEIATTYGWPIHQWDVSNCQNFFKNLLWE
jgi:hypothetical protein